MTMKIHGGDRQTVLLIVTVVFGLAGGALVIPIMDLSKPVWFLLVAGAAAVATLVSFVLLTSEHRPPEHRPRPAPGQNRPPAPAPAPTAPAPAPTNTSAPGHVVLPVEASGQWWTQSATTRNNTTSAQQADPAPPLSTYVAKGAALVAQCPHCGDFRLDVHRGEPAYAFRCRNPHCRHEWRWTPGTDWPAVVVRRNLTGEPTGRDRR
jgi:uncharacterized protein (DUF983 family)